MQGTTNRKKEAAENKRNAHEKLEQDISLKKQPSLKVKGVDLQQLELIKEPKEAVTSLEFLICTLASKFELKVQQVKS